MSENGVHTICTLIIYKLIYSYWYKNYTQKVAIRDRKLGFILLTFTLHKIWWKSSLASFPPVCHPATALISVASVPFPPSESQMNTAVDLDVQESLQVQLSCWLIRLNYFIYNLAKNVAYRLQLITSNVFKDYFYHSLCKNSACMSNSYNKRGCNNQWLKRFLMFK